MYECLKRVSNRLYLEDVSCYLSISKRELLSSDTVSSALSFSLSVFFSVTLFVYLPGRSRVQTGTGQLVPLHREGLGKDQRHTICTLSFYNTQDDTSYNFPWSFPRSPQRSSTVFREGDLTWCRLWVGLQSEEDGPSVFHPCRLSRFLLSPGCIDSYYPYTEYNQF